MGALQHVFVQVGGLCMLVQHDRKLFVLMPRMEHVGHRHCQFLHVNDPYANGGGLWSLKGGTLDLSSLSNRGRPQSTADTVLEASRWTGNSPVTASHLQGTGSPSGRLAARVILPLSSQPFKELGKPAELMLVGPGMPIGPVKSHGRVGIHIAVSGNLDELRIPWPGVTLTPDARGSVELTLLNMRPKDLGEDPSASNQVPCCTTWRRTSPYSTLGEKRRQPCMLPTGASPATRRVPATRTASPPLSSRFRAGDSISRAARKTLLCSSRSIPTPARSGVDAPPPIPADDIGG